ALYRDIGGRNEPGLHKIAQVIVGPRHPLRGYTLARFRIDGRIILGNEATVKLWAADGIVEIVDTPATRCTGTECVPAGITRPVLVLDLGAPDESALECGR